MWQGNAETAGHAKGLTPGICACQIAVFDRFRHFCLLPRANAIQNNALSGAGLVWGSGRFFGVCPASGRFLLR
jgi:hypothetical protein